MDKELIRTPLKAFKSSFSKEELLELFKEKEVKEALFLASPNLLEEMQKLVEGNLSSEKEEGVLLAFLKYSIRMHSRCTPFGLFAGCTVVEAGNTISLNEGKARRKTRLDMNFTCALAKELSMFSPLQPYLKFFPNSSLYKVHDKLRYVEYYFEQKHRIHQISAVDDSEYLQIMLHTAKGGATMEEIARSITSDEISIDEALAFTQSIIQEQLLVSELEPAVTGSELLSQITTTLGDLNRRANGIPELVHLLEELKEVQHQLEAIDDKFGNEISTYRNLAKKLKKLNVPFDLGRLFQTDLSIQLAKNPLKEETQNNSYETRKELKKALRILNKLNLNRGKYNLKEFKRKFYERYEEQEVSLSIALDNEIGVGYGQNTNYSGNKSPLIQGLSIPSATQEEIDIRWNKGYTFLLEKLFKARESKEYRIVIDPDELKEFKENWDDLPDSFSILYANHGKREEEAYLGVCSVGGSSAINLLGRFASSDQEIHELVQEIEKKESEISDSILAEIVHLPESRTGNVLMRPAFRPYEIPYLSKSNLKEEQQLKIDDLMISIRNNRIYLRSKRLNKEIVPRMGNAHNFDRNALPIYNFLCDIQVQGKREYLYFDWGPLKREFPFLPRVEVGKTILSYATWYVERDQFLKLLEKGELLKTRIDAFKKKINLPDKILFCRADNKLLIDFTNELSCKVFVSMLKNEHAVVLEEFIFNEETAIVRNKKGNAFVNEKIAILTKEKSIISPSFTSREDEDDLIPPFSRSLSLGSEWLYYKVYCGISTADKVLSNIIQPLAEELIKEQLIDQWFFIRYSDPELHLRIRFHLTKIEYLNEVVQRFHQVVEEYQQNQLIWKIQVDSYQREIERYGKNSMLFSEQLFFIDSICIVNLISTIEGEDENYRWLAALSLIDGLLNDFQYSIEQKESLLNRLKTSFAYEFNVDKGLKIQMGNKYRKYRALILKLVQQSDKEDEGLLLIANLILRKSQQQEKTVKNILRLQEMNQLSINLDDLLASYIHMSLNRLFKAHQRFHEMVVYDFLWRTYLSIIKRKNN